MLNSFLVAWYQLSHQKVKLAVAAAGVVVAVMLMLVQLGIREGAMDNSVAVARRITADLVVLSPRTRTMFQSNPFPRRLLFRLPGHPEVDSVQELYMGQARFQNPWMHQEHPIAVYGIDPRSELMRLPGFSDYESELRLPDRVLFDGRSRTVFGPVVEELRRAGTVATEMNYRRMTIVGAIDVGISVTTDGNVYTTPANFLRIFPARNPGAVDVGLVRLKPGADAERVADELRPYLGTEATIRTQQQLVNDEIQFMRETAPIDFIFGMGAMVGFFIGFVVVYQILYTEVTNHLPQFATMKAMGFDDQYLLKIVLSQAAILSVLGYVPGFFLAIWLYQLATVAIQMQFAMTTERALLVFGLTTVMCGLSAVIAVQKARTADPADVF